MTTLHLKHSMNGSPLRLALLHIPLALVCFAFSPTARAQISPAPDGGGAKQNTAEGDFSLASLTSGSFNTALGFAALDGNTGGSGNTATGAGALFSNGTGDGNTATGGAALFSNITGGGNTAIGTAALSTNTGGSNNIAVGAGAGVGITTGDHNIDIGSVGTSLDSGTIRIGDLNTQFCVIAGIAGVSVTGAAVVVDPDGQLGVSSSSARFKDEIKPMDKASEAILALKPVTFHYKKGIDPKGGPQFGLVAEEVEKVNPALIVRDKEGKPFTVRYDAVNAMLLNEFLKEHRKVEQLEKQVEALTAGLQKVSDQLELSKPAPQTVLNQ